MLPEKMHLKSSVVDLKGKLESCFLFIIVMLHIKPGDNWLSVSGVFGGCLWLDHTERLKIDRLPCSEFVELVLI